jgi:hypothetical protein
MKPSFAYLICFLPPGFAIISLDQVAMPHPPRDTQPPNLVAVSSPQLYPGATLSVLCGMNSSHISQSKHKYAQFGLGTFMPAQTKLCGYTFEPFEPLFGRRFIFVHMVTTGVSVGPMTNVGKCENISGSSWKGSISLGSLSRLSQPICQNVGGVTRWARERRAFPVSSLSLASSRPFCFKYFIRLH